MQFSANLRSKVLSNAFYLLALQALNTLLPLFTIPFLVRVLGVSHFGVIAFSQVIASYMSVVSDYGFNLSTTRLLSVNKGNAEKTAEIFNAVISLKVIIMLLCFITFSPFVFFVDKLWEFRDVYFLTYGIVLGQVLFPVWYFQGIQEMQTMVVLNAISKIISTVLIFVFIKQPEHIVLVVFLNAAASILVGILGLLLAKKKGRIVYKLPTRKQLKLNLKDGFDVFIPTFFSNVINNGGVFVLGVFHSSALVGYYSAIDKLIRAALNLFYPISQALFPSMAERLSENRKSAVDFIIKVGAAITGIILFGILLSIFFSDDLITLLYGQEYTAYSYVLIVLMVWFLFGVINNFIGVQYLVGSGNGATYRKAFSIAGVSILLMYSTIKYFDINGVIFSMLAGEILLTILMLYFIKRKKTVAN